LGKFGNKNSDEAASHMDSEEKGCIAVFCQAQISDLMIRVAPLNPL